LTDDSTALSSLALAIISLYKLQSKTIEIDGGVVGVVGANIEGKVSEQISLLAGVAYQIDIAKGGSTWLGEDLDEDSELEAFLVKIGVIIKL